MRVTHCPGVMGAGAFEYRPLLVAASAFGSICFTYEEDDFALDANTARLVGSIVYGVFRLLARPPTLASSAD